ncbi:hypothetical protein LBU01_11400 [Lentilactobacillus buchneri]|nr:hypothetical protein LBU01_11400 [Lentilactobacillus buchneri]
MRKSRAYFNLNGFEIRTIPVKTLFIAIKVYDILMKFSRFTEDYQTFSSLQIASLK